jgi:hypothetical protein
MKTIIKHVLEIDQVEATKRLIKNFMEGLQGSMGNIEYFTMDLNRLQEILKEINTTGRMEYLFKYGYTSMVLSDKDMEEVDNYFRRTEGGTDKSEELEIHIMDNLGIKLESIPQRYISY